MYLKLLYYTVFLVVESFDKVPTHRLDRLHSACTLILMIDLELMKKVLVGSISLAHLYAHIRGLSRGRRPFLLRFLLQFFG